MGRWDSEGGAGPEGPATHTASGHEDTDDLPTQEEQPEQGTTAAGEPAPEEIGESG